MYLISIYFDKDTEKRINSMMQHVADATGNTFMQDNQVPAHITVAAVETRNETALMEQMEALIKQLSTGEIKFVSVGSFATKVLYLQPVLNEYLHTLSEVVKKELEGLEDTILSPYYQPFNWLPHTTIAKQLTKEQMQQAFSVLQNEFVPMEGKVVRIGVAKTNPHRDIKLWEL